MGLKLTIQKDGETILTVTSDGHAKYKIRGKSLRDNVKSYKTDDDLHVLGLVSWQLTAFNSTEYLKRRLDEHDATQSV